jgi:hypothetical protein
MTPLVAKSTFLRGKFDPFENRQKTSLFHHDFNAA